MVPAHVLILNVDYSPLEVVSWREAIEKYFTGKVEIIEEYEGRSIRSPSVEIPYPAVARLVSTYAQRQVRLSRKHVIERDSYTCQYCGIRPKKSSGAPDFSCLTVDHVVHRPQARGGWVTLPWNGQRVRTTSWENVLTACEPCNMFKGGRTPSEAGMVMKSRPKAPSPIDIAWMNIRRHRIPDEWKAYLPESAAEWAGYWDDELED